MLTDLAWLPQVGEAERERLRALLADPPGAAAWRGLMAFAWSDSELRRAGQHLRKAWAAGSLNPADGGAAPLRMLVIATQTFSHMLDAVIASAYRHGVALDITLAEYATPESWLADPANRCDGFDLILVAADASAWRLAPSGDEKEADALGRLEKSVERVLDGLAERGAASVVLQTVCDDLNALSIHLDATIPGSRQRLLQGLNDRIGQAAASRGALVLDWARLTAMLGLETWWPGRFWFSAKLPFAQRCIPFYGDNLGRILAARVGKSRRVFVLDLDNTLWGGVIGDDGLNGIVLGQGSAAGEAHLAIQRIARAYAGRGVVLAVASKNTHDIAMEVFETHPDMVLREADLAATQINWNDKASNIRALAQTLNLGLESFVFLDDNPVERKQVRDALPEVAVPELPQDPSDWPVLLQAAGYFEQVSFTTEDRQRGAYYKAMAARSQVAAEVGDTDAFLRSLDTQIVIEPFNALGRKRIAQLISKSNQFNLTTRRYSETEVERFEQDPSIVSMQIRLSDIFGDAGMISVVIGRLQDQALHIDTWLMSCRVLGRRVQEAALQALVGQAKALGATRLVGYHAPTPRNGIVADHYSKLGFQPVAESSDASVNLWRLDIEDYRPPDLPMTIKTAGY